MMRPLISSATMSIFTTACHCSTLPPADFLLGFANNFDKDAIGIHEPRAAHNILGAVTCIKTLRYCTLSSSCTVIVSQMFHCINFSKYKLSVATLFNASKKNSKIICVTSSHLHRYWLKHLVICLYTNWPGRHSTLRRNDSELKRWLVKGKQIGCICFLLAVV